MSNLSLPSPAQIKEMVRERLFARSIIQNNYRGEVVEDIVRSAIEPNWIHCGDNWNAWDFEQSNSEHGKLRLQVKQSAAVQSWDTLDEPIPIRKGKFPIRLQSGYYEGDKWKPVSSQRIAEIYILCWHAEVSNADHFDVSQWLFYILQTSEIEKFDDENKGYVKNTISVEELDNWNKDGRVICARYQDLKKDLESVALKTKAKVTPPSHSATS